MAGIPSPDAVLPKLERIAELARQAPEMAFTSLAHHIDANWLREAYRRTRKDGAAGVDGQSAAEYAVNLEGNLQSLLDRAKSGTYRAPPVRRVHIPKGDGSQVRPIGIPTFEDKVLQRAVAMALEAVYEQDFLECSYGFRPGRSAHQALATLRKAAMDAGGGWVVEVDIRKFFDTLDHAQLREILRRRVRDGVLLRLIGKGLNAGVLEAGQLSYPDAGTPQGGVITPPTQLTTRNGAALPSARVPRSIFPVVVSWRLSGRWLRRRKPIDDGRSRLVDLNLSDERTNDLPALDPRQRLELALYTGRKVFQARRDCTQMHALVDLVLDLGKLTTGSLDPRAESLTTCLQIAELDSPASYASTSRLSDRSWLATTRATSSRRCRRSAETPSLR